MKKRLKHNFLYITLEFYFFVVIAVTEFHQSTDWLRYYIIFQTAPYLIALWNILMSDWSYKRRFEYRFTGPLKAKTKLIRFYVEQVYKKRNLILNHVNHMPLNQCHKLMYRTLTENMNTLWIRRSFFYTLRSFPILCAPLHHHKCHLF